MDFANRRILASFGQLVSLEYLGNTQNNIKAVKNLIIYF